MNQKAIISILEAIKASTFVSHLPSRHDIFLSFEESIFGAKRDIEVSCNETCDYCGGTGAKSRNCIILCKRCVGRGAVMQTQEPPFGVMSQVSTCSKYGVDGKPRTEKCQYCKGKGII